MEKFNRVLHLSRSVHFDCTITIDQLINIPLLNGRFKIKWKFSQPAQDPATAPANTQQQQQQQQQQPIDQNNLSELHHPLPAQLVELPIKSEPSGATDYHEIKNHSVLFRHAFHCPISITLDKQTVLQPSILTIIVKEEHVNETGRRIVNRHGSIDIDLSQYTPLIDLAEQHAYSHRHPSAHHHNNNLSRIEKAKFLLRDCKTNASLKLQIQMDYLGGMTPFKMSVTQCTNPLVYINMKY
jgi:hypothetical protein